MNSLMNYGSDGENSNDSDDAKVLSPVIKSSIPARRASDAIYDPVPMDMSEESNNNNSSDDSRSERIPVKPYVPGSHRTESIRNISSFSDQRRIDNEERSSSSHDDHKPDKSNESNVDKREKISRHGSDKKGDDKRRGSDHKEGKDSKRSRVDDKKSRDDRKSRDDEKKSRDNDRRKNKSSKDDKNDDKNERDHRRDRDKRDDKDRRRDRDRDRERGRDRDRSRDRDRDRRHSKDGKSRDRHRDDRHSRDKDPVRSRSRSRDQGTPHRPFSYREERNKTKLAQLEKLGIEIKVTDADGLQHSNQQSFYNPLATATQGKYAEQIQKRKLLWANKKQEDNKTAAAPATANTWVGTTFTHDQDGKVTAKFKRLMGIKGDLPATPAPGAKPDILKKQEEMFNNMEQQYEVARATTHTQRGVGLGYASGSFPFPR